MQRYCYCHPASPLACFNFPRPMQNISPILDRNRNTRAMGKTGKWLRNILAGGKKKEKEKENVERIGCLSSPLPIETRSAPISVSTSKEKRRWSFRRPAGKEPNSPDLDLLVSTPNHGLFLEPEMDQKKHAMAVAVATAAAADAAVAAIQAAAAVIRLTAANSSRNRVSAVEDAAAVKIQAAFRSHLAKKALRALKGLVKLQALVRGHLVRKQTTATLFCMQSSVMIQARARAQQSRMLEESQTSTHRQIPVDRRSPQHPRFRRSYEMVERCVEENVKIVEMDLGESRGSFKSRNSYSITQSERTEDKFSAYGGSRMDSMADPYQQVSPAPSSLTDVSPRACSGHYKDFSFTTPQRSPYYFSATSIPDATRSSFIVSRHEGTYPMSNDYPFFPSYMATTESSKAKARSQSAPKQRPDIYERQPSRRRQSVEGRNIPRSARMQRSSSHVGSSTNGYQYPWSIKLDKSNMSLKDSECGSTSTILTNTNYCRFMGIDK